jgi:hypothetical protein
MRERAPSMAENGQGIARAMQNGSLAPSGHLVEEADVLVDGGLILE